MTNFKLDKLIDKTLYWDVKRSTMSSKLNSLNSRVWLELHKQVWNQIECLVWMPTHQIVKTIYLPIDETVRNQTIHNTIQKKNE